jgi:hypothetical protein
MSNKQYNPCGGCGAETPNDRCIGCMHPFEKMQELKDAQEAARMFCNKHNETAKLLSESVDKNKRLFDFVKSLSEDVDHNEDSHKYNVWCWKCEAEKLVSEIEKGDVA